MHLPLRIDSVRRFLLIGIPIGGALVIFSMVTFGLAIHAFASILLYAFLCELYIFCFTLVISSVSVTMLMLLQQTPMEISTFTRTYDPREMVNLRVDRLIKYGFIERKGTQFVVGSKGMRLHRVFGILRRFFRHEFS
jgi:hypothetical protein